MARERLDLPAYLGSTLRGAFGHVFRTLACPGRFNQPCPIPDTCPYHLIFETSPPPGSEALRTHDEIPRPFVISPITDDGAKWLERGRHEIAPGSELSFYLTLIGRAQEFFPYFVVALREIDRLGRHREHLAQPGEVGAPRRVRDIEAGGESSAPGVEVAFSPPPARADGQPSRLSPHKTVELRRIDLLDPLSNNRHGGRRYGLTRVYDAADNLVRPRRKSITLSDCAALPAPASGRFTLDFLTQTRLKHEGGFARVPEFQIVFRRLLGRLSSLSRFHCGAPLDIDFRGLIDQAGQVRLIENQTRWVSWTRYSSRQRQRMDWEGLVGRSTYEGDIEGLWRYLVFGQWTHVGKGATFGLGKYMTVWTRKCLVK